MSLTQEVISLPLPPGLRHLLVAHGVSSVDDLHASVHGLVEAGILSTDQASELMRVLHSTEPGWGLAGAASALSLARRPPDTISTSSPSLDRLLGGRGVACGCVTEFCGVPGVGKTQLGIQLAVNVQLPRSCGGLDGQAVYIDTEGSFMADRAAEVAAAAAAAVRARAPDAPCAQAGGAEGLLQGVLRFRVHDAAEQLAVMRMLDSLLSQRPQVRLVVVDSVSMHLRGLCLEAGARSRALAALAQCGAALAEARGVALVLINQVTTRVHGEQQPGQLVPALGDAWGQAARVRVVLHWNGPRRCAHLLKSPDAPPCTVPFQVTASGVGG